MIETVKRSITSQYEAGLCTIYYCVARCPDALWNSRVAKYPFCQAAFHALFYADYYLSPEPDAFRTQPFHLAHAAFFGDYEQLEDREPVGVYEKLAIQAYVRFCRDKAIETLAAETAEDLEAKTKFNRKDFSRLEAHIYNIRHLQHHSAQLSLRLRLDSDVDTPWIGAGWREPGVGK
ncbi:MAG: hypothetical protein H7210_11860 [Pyrinomonadaceae bacterium]|nr:hypothetical protein [Phycisphaerales bacterium]